MADYDVTVPGVAGHLTITEPTFLRGARLLVNGTPPEKIRANCFRLAKVDGLTTEAKLQFSFGQYLPTLVIDGVRYEVGPKLGKPMLALSFLPFCLVFVGGALGGLCGAIGWGFNNQLARTSLPPVVKVVAMLLVTAVSIVTYLGLATLFHLAIKG